MQYDAEEKNILETFESGNLQLSKPSEREIEAIKNAARNTFKKNKRITIRLYEHDIGFGRGQDLL